MQKAPTMAGIRLLCVLWDLSSGPVTETKARSGGYEPCGSGDHPESLENFTWFNKKKRKKEKERKWNGDRVALNEGAYCCIIYVSPFFFLYLVTHAWSTLPYNIVFYLLNLFRRCVCACIWNSEKKEKKKKKKRKRSRMRLFLKHFTTQHTGVTVQHPQFTGYMCVLLGGFV